MSGTLDVVQTGKPYINREYLAPQPPENANYREGADGRNCGSCLYFEDGACAVYNASVDPNKVCDAFEKDEDLNQETYTMGELYCADGNATGENSDGEIVKTVLRTGLWRYSPGPGQVPIPTPLRVVAGKSADLTKEIGLADIVESYKDGAIQHVTVPLSHEDKVHENTGFVKNLFIEPDPDHPDGHRLRAVFNFTEPDIAEKVSNGSIANTSVGLLFDYIRKDDGKKYGIALAHVALTNHPWINGMAPFGIAASEAENIVSLELEAAPIEEPTQAETVVWRSRDSYRGVESKIYTALSQYKKEDRPPPYGVTDVVPGKALINNWDSNETYVVPFTEEDNGENINLAPQDQWIKAEQEWVKASEAYSEQIQSYSVETPAEHTPEKPKPTVKTVTLSAQDGLRESQRRRELRLSQTTNTKRTGGNSMSDVLEGLELADDVRSQLESALESQEEVRRLRADVRQRQVEDRVEELKEIGFSEQPGLLAYVRQVLLSDDQGTALLLSEDGEAGKKDAKLTAAEVIEGFIARLPKTDGKVNFGEQATDLGTGTPPPKDTREENKDALDSRITSANEWLYGNKE